jgi:hypothetical protein
MQPLNLSAHCLECWQSIGTDNAFGHATRLLAEELRAAPKFLLEEGGRPLDDEGSIARMFPDLHLPYPCVALEYLSTGAIAAHEIKSSKRIALAWDLRQGCPRAFVELAGGSPVRRPSLLVQSLSYIDVHDFWMPVLGFVEIQLDSTIGRLTRQQGILTCTNWLRTAFPSAAGAFRHTAPWSTPTTSTS